MTASVRIIRDHARGRLPLRTSFFIAFATIAVAAGIGLAAVAFAQGAGDVAGLAVALGRDAILAVIAAWALIGLWNAAGRAVREGSARALPGMAKLAVLAGAILGLHLLISAVPGRVTVLAARLDPALSEHLIARTGPDEITFEGALDDRAIAALDTALANPSIRVLRITSPGGLIVPAMDLAERVRKRRIAVAAIGRCLSSCTILLAASPSAITTPGTRIAFHRPAPAVALANIDRAELAILNARWYARLREYGIAPKAVQEMARHDIWSPGLAVLVDIGLVDYVLDGKPQRLTPARTWCRAHIQACLRH